MWHDIGKVLNLKIIVFRSFFNSFIYCRFQMLHRNSSGFDEKETLDDLIKTYGYEAGFEPEEPVVKGSPTKKRKGVKDEGEKDQAGSPSSVKKVRKTDIVAREENRAAAEAIKEMADIYFKNKDNRKGGIIDNIQHHYS